MAKDTWKPTPHKDSITGKRTDASGNGGSYSIDSKIEKVQREAWPQATNADELHDALMLLGAMTPEEAANSIHHEGNGAAAQHLQWRYRVPP